MSVHDVEMIQMYAKIAIPEEQIPLRNDISENVK